MKEYIEKILHQNIQLIPYEERGLPLVYRNGYSLFQMVIGQQECLLAVPLESTNLAYLRKQQKQLEIYTGLPCVLYLREMNYYAKDIMVNEGIPFVWEEHQVYLPFMGILLDSKQRKAVTSCVQISFLTQRLLLTALYQDWKNLTVTKAAELLEVTKTSVSRCFDELEALHVRYLTVRSRARSFSVTGSKKEMWETLKPVMRNPVIATYSLKEKPQEIFMMGGVTALSYYSMLNDDLYPVFAVPKKEMSRIKITGNMLSPAGEVPGCMIQELGYQIRFQDGKAVDPLTLTLSLSDEEKEDPRISMAVDEMLEEYVW